MEMLEAIIRIGAVVLIFLLITLIEPPIGGRSRPLVILVTLGSVFLILGKYLSFMDYRFHIYHDRETPRAVWIVAGIIFWIIALIWYFVD
jgi:hypothetical protein